MIKKILTFCWLLVVGSCLLAKPVFGKDFSSYYKTVYTFDADGQGFVEQEISLVNERPDLYVSEYTLSLNGTHIENIQAFDKVGPIKVNKEIKDDTTLIKLMFNEKEVGKGKILSFILKYQSPDLAEKKGNLWEITIPKLGNAGEIDTYQAVLNVPLSFGDSAYTNPKPDKEERNSKFYSLTFNKDKLAGFGVIASFGKWQTFKFSLDYELLNETSSPAIGIVALPPDTSYQVVYYDRINPLPENVEVDKDGNWLASFLVPAKTTLKINTQGSVNLFSSRKNGFPQQADQLDQYLKEDFYWQTNDKEIKKIVENLKTPQEIYNYVVKTLTYSKEATSNPVRKGSLEALKNPAKSLCSEFTDLFITLCRAAGIPSRELEGFAYTDDPLLNLALPNQDLLHSWPEYYDADKGYWVMVDPTFGSTAFGLDYFNNFDMNHFAFVVHGQSSREPFPAGSYKSSDKAKQVSVSFGPDVSKSMTENLELGDIFPKSIYSLRKNKITFDLINLSGFALYNQRLAFNNQLYFPSDLYISVIPPFGKVQNSVSIKPKETFNDYALSSSLQTDDNLVIAFPQKVKSLALRGLILGGISTSVVLFGILKSLKVKNKVKYYQ